MATWWVDKNYNQHFTSISEVFAMDGEAITKAPLSRVKKTDINGVNYYIKLYSKAGKHLRRWFGRSRACAEWENLLLFKSLGIPIPKIIAYGEERQQGKFRGIFVTEELKGYIDLANFATRHPQFLRHYAWRNQLVDQVASYALRLHQIGFIHNDLKWRNILINDRGQPDAYFIDCPLGRKRHGFLFKRGVIKDLACLDKGGKRHLSKTARLRFYFRYNQIKKLTPTHKKNIAKILDFFQGRD